ncbi:pentapeptide repeat-containing protein [Streptomyces caelestis]|uniref:pentapeptide repeat-containing protein n=1 Tax=Streptomyces caelestis TaxID=36816 RepID=UPI0021AA5C00
MSHSHPRSWQGHGFDFTGAVFDGADFSSTEFIGGTVDFTGAQFTGSAVDFNVVFNGGTVDFSRAYGVAPNGLPSSGSSLPPGLILPPTW